MLADTQIARQIECKTRAIGYRKYSDEFKREVLVMVPEVKRSIAQIERALNISELAP